MKEKLEYYDKILANMLCEITLAPTNDMDFMWKFTTTHKYVDMDTRPDPVTDVHLPIYDIKTKQWIQIAPELIMAIEFLHFKEHVKCEHVENNNEQPDATICIDSQTGDASVLEFEDCYESQQITPTEWVDAKCEHEMFDSVAYYKDVENAIEELSVHAGQDPWRVNFKPLTKFGVVHWGKMLEITYDDAFVDLMGGRLDMKKVSDGWNRLMQERADKATKILSEEKLELTAEIKWLDIVKRSEITGDELTTEQQAEIKALQTDIVEQLSKDMKGTNNVDIVTQEIEDRHEQIEEIQVIEGLIEQQTKEYMKMSSDCYDIYELRDMWPPILLPMPFKNYPGVTNVEEVLDESQG